MDTVTHDTLRQDYADPVGRLLTAGELDFDGPEKWIDYPTHYQFGPEHVPELIRMACDVSLHTGDGDEPRDWAPIHAWRALGQLRAGEAVEPLLAAMYDIRETEAPYEELATVFGMIGPAAIPPIDAFLRDQSLEWALTATAGDGLTKIVERNPESRDDCVAALTRALEGAADRDPTANGFTVGCLLDLGAAEAIDTIRAAFQTDAVDISIAGDLEDAEIELGFRERRATRKPYYPFASPGFARKSFSTESVVAESRYEYVDVRSTQKIGRNEPCPCGSGKKFKKCCLE